MLFNVKLSGEPQLVKHTGVLKSKSGNIIFKICLSGETGVGKTSLFQRYLKNDFVHGSQITMGIDYGSKSIDLDLSTKVKLQLWDTAGQKSFLSLTEPFFKDCSCVILQFDFFDRSSFDKLIKHYEIAKQYSPSHVNYYVVGNKIDRRQQEKQLVEVDEIKNFLKSINVPQDQFFESSVQDNLNIDEVFIRISRELYLDYIIYSS